MSDRDSNSIVLVVVRNFFFYLYEGMEHPGDRLLVGAAVARSSTLHFARRIFKNLDACALCGIDESSAHFSDPTAAGRPRRSAIGGAKMAPHNRPTATATARAT